MPPGSGDKMTLRLDCRLEPETRVVQIAAKSLNSPELAALANGTQSATGIANTPKLQVLRATCNDEASVNKAALNLIKPLYPFFDPDNCFGHNFNRVGQSA